MDNYIMNAIPEVIQQISKVLSDESGQLINLVYTGKSVPTEVGLSVEFQDIDIPSHLISPPVPSNPNDKDGFYRVTRIRLGETILRDTYNGCPFSDDEIKLLLKANGKWGYHQLVK